jgi:hypothetical protein
VSVLTAIRPNTLLNTSPETTSMKGLVLTNLEKREEGIQLIKDGLKLDLTSHICWHVNGIVQKADRNYEKALTCYARALTYDKVCETRRLRYAKTDLGLESLRTTSISSVILLSFSSSSVSTMHCRTLERSYCAFAQTFDSVGLVSRWPTHSMASFHKLDWFWNNTLPLSRCRISRYFILKLIVRDLGRPQT